MSKIRVVKRRRDKEARTREENFERRKIEKSIRAAGASSEIAKRVARDVEADLMRIHTAAIRDKVIRRLRVDSPRAARTFETFRK